MRNHDIYAHAFYEATAPNQISEYISLNIIVNLFESHPELGSTLLFDRSKFDIVKTQILDDVSEHVKRFISILVEDGMIDQLSRIGSKIRDLLIDHELWYICTIETAHEIDVHAYDKIKNIVSKYYLGHIEFNSVVNESLKSGYRITINDTMIDLSIEGRIKEVVKEVTHG